jgi:hypothetical protein
LLVASVHRADSHRRLLRLLSALATVLRVPVRKQINNALRRSIEYELRRWPPTARDKPDPARRLEAPPIAPDPADHADLVARCREIDRLLTGPTFVLSSVRSGSTLLRLILDSHPEICSPHELHLRRRSRPARCTAVWSSGTRT